MEIIERMNLNENGWTNSNTNAVNLNLEFKWKYLKWMNSCENGWKFSNESEGI